MKRKKQIASVGVGVLINKKGKIILIKRQGSHGARTWAPPGGHIDFGESVFDCAKREVKEEVNIKIKNLKVLGFTQDLFKKDKKHYITIWVKSDWQSGRPKRSYREFSTIGWFSWQKLPKPLSIFLKNFTKGEIMPR
jgi:8-oxo-dGTP diphosphatase